VSETPLMEVGEDEEITSFGGPADEPSPASVHGVHSWH